jgi:MarR family transcriptional regulator for hemolysin
MHLSTLLKRTTQQLIKKANVLLKPHHLSHAYTSFLMELYPQGGLPQGELHKRIGIEQPTAVRTLDRLERDGLIQRSPSATNRRSVLIYLTAKAHALKPSLEKAALDLNICMLEGFTDSEKELLRDFLQRIAHNLTP